MRLFQFIILKTGGAKRFSAHAGMHGKFILIVLSFLLATFAGSLYFFFPTQVLKERIEQQVATRTTAGIDIGKLSLVFPAQLRARDINVLIKNAPPKPLHISALTVKPLWGSLLSNNPGISFTAKLYEGDMLGTVYRGGQTKAQSREIFFSAPLMEGSSLAITGIVKNGDLIGTFPLKPKKETTLSLEFDEVTLKGLESLGGQQDDLLLGSITLEATGKGNSFKISSLESSGKDLTASGSGTILVGAPLERSRLNLRLTINPGPTFDKNIKELLDLFIKPGRDGSYRIRVTGHLANPKIQ